MSRARFPHGRAIVQSVTIEALIDPTRPCDGIGNLICGHCGQMSSNPTDLCYNDPELTGWSYEEQTDMNLQDLQAEQICPHCGVKNVSQDVETYLRDQEFVMDVDIPDAGEEQG